MVFDPYLSSRPLAEALRKAPRGKLIVGGQYYTFSSIFFYTEYRALLLNGRVNNLEYGSYAPKAPKVFIDDAEFARLWGGPERCYLAIEDLNTPQVEQLAGAANLHTVSAQGGKTLYTNQPPEAVGEGSGACGLRLTPRPCSCAAPE